MDRTDFNGSPGYFTHDSVTWQLLDDEWQADSSIVTIPVKSNLQGTLGEREDYSMTTVKATPVAFRGTLSTLWGKLFPYQPSHRGTLLFGSSNKPLVIQTKSGESITFSSAAMMTPPELQFRAGLPLFSGPAEWLCLRKNNTDASAADAHVAVASSAYSEPAFDPENIVSCRFTMNWGPDAPFLGIEVDKDGVKLKVTYQWEEDLDAWNDGMLNKRLADVTAAASFTPVNLDAADLLNTMLILDGSAAGRGKFLSGRGLELSIAGPDEGDPRLVIPCAAATKAPIRFGSKSRVGMVDMTAQRKYSGGSLQPLFTLDVVPEA